MRLTARFCKDESGATAIEYGLIASCVFIAIIAGVTMLGDQVSEAYVAISSAVANAGGSGS